MRLAYTLLLTAAVAATTAYLVRPEGSATAAKETAYERVLRTGTLRCGYLTSFGYHNLDPNTKEMSGMVYDVINQMAKNLSLKVEWVEEIGRGDFIPALQQGRFDLYCTAVSANAGRAREALMTAPYYLDPVYVYGRAESPLIMDVSALNRADLSYAVIEGDIFERIAQRYMPLAKPITLPQLTPVSELFVMLADGKTDMVIATPFFAQGYMQNTQAKSRVLRSSR